jgi:DNA processing protein
VSLSDGERFARLRLARTDRVGPVAFRQLLQRFGSAERAVDAWPHLTARAGRDAPLCDPAKVEAEVEAGAAVGAKLIMLGDAIFPTALAAVDPPPPLLWALGDPRLLIERPCIAVVGARVASAGGVRIARGLASQLGEAGWIVVSGLARGVDGAAHEGALPTGTVAVLGGGVDDVYPPDHRDLHRQVAERGCIVSERPPGARAQAADFPRRNRIISGLSRGVIVVEAELRSGSLITARQAADQGREVFAVPGSPLDPRSRGTNDLIRNGAALCEGLEDVERAFASIRTLSEPPVDAPDYQEPDDVLIERVAALLSPTPTPRDELARAVSAPVGAVAAALLELSLVGRASLLPGGLVSS